VDTQQLLDSLRVHERKTTQVEMELATVSLARGIGDCALEFPSARDVQFALHVHDVGARVVLVPESQQVVHASRVLPGRASAAEQ